MSPAAGPLSPSSDVAPAISPAFTGTGILTPAQKDKVIEWYRGEFAAANAIIDALCHHLVQITGGVGGGADIPADYEAVFAAVHRRRLNWIPVLQMQKYFTISDVAHELRKAAARREKVAAMEVVTVEEKEEVVVEVEVDKEVAIDSDGVKCNGVGNGCVSSEGEDSPDSEITDTGKSKQTFIFSI